MYFFRVLIPRWETAFLPWDLLCSPGRIAWEGDNNNNKWQRTDITTTRPNRPSGPMQWKSANLEIWIFLVCADRSKKKERKNIQTKKWQKIINYKSVTYHLLTPSLRTVGWFTKTETLSWGTSLFTQTSKINLLPKPSNQKRLSLLCHLNKTLFDPKSPVHVVPGPANRIHRQTDGKMVTATYRLNHSRVYLKDISKITENQTFPTKALFDKRIVLSDFSKHLKHSILNWAFIICCDP